MFEQRSFHLVILSAPVHPIHLNYKVLGAAPADADISVLGGISASAPSSASAMGLARHGTRMPWSCRIESLAKAIERGAFKHEEKREGDEKTWTLWCQVSLDTCRYVGRHLLTKHPDCGRNKFSLNTGIGYHRCGLTLYGPHELVLEGKLAPGWDFWKRIREYLIQHLLQ